MQWFKHDSDAHADSKLKRVRMKYGMEGYGLYWYCLELIARDVKETNITFELDHDSELIAHDTGINYKVVEEMILYMVELGLFEQSSGIITCLKMAKRLDQSMTSSKYLREKIAEIKINHDGVMIDSDEVMKNRIEKKRKESSGKSSRFIPPTIDEVKTYITERQSPVNPDRFFDFNESKGWKVGSARMKDWKAAVRTWEGREKNNNQGAPKPTSGGYTGVEI